MNKNITIIVAIVLFVGIGIIAYTVPPKTDTGNQKEKTALPTKTEQEAGIANPASQACEAFGYTIDIRKDENGGEVGYCVFFDGTECEEWSFFRNECGIEWKKGTTERVPADTTKEKYAGCPRWVNCMPGPGADPNRCYISPQCEGYTQRAY